jgi:hypothetical protein
MRRSSAVLLLVTSASCVTEPSRVFHGPIVVRQEQAASGYPVASIVVWPKGAACSDAVRLSLTAATRVRMRYGSVLVDTTQSVLTVGRVVSARALTSAVETSCPMGTTAKVIVVEPETSGGSSR